MRYAWVADHFQYLASLGPIVLAAAGLAGLATTPARRVVLAAVIVLLGSRTFARCGAYRTEETLWRDTIAANPAAWIAHNNLGILLAERGAEAEAAAAFARVLELRPEHSGARANLGYLSEIMGRPEEAVLRLTEAAVERPDDADVRIHLVRVLVGLGRFDEALAPALEAARLAPGDADVLCDAGALLARAGRTTEAIPLLERALTLRPGFARAQANLERARRAAPDVGYPRAR
jgi:Flp pilus assembly protein TadD